MKDIGCTKLTLIPENINLNISKMKSVTKSNIDVQNIIPDKFYVVIESYSEEGNWEQLSIKLDTYEEALKFKNTTYHKEEHPNAFIVCSVKNIK